jgi:O-antigen ligase
MAGGFAAVLAFGVILKWNKIVYLLAIMRQYPVEFFQVLTSDRSYLWYCCVMMFLAKPWTGYGYGAEIAAPNYTNAHNIFFNLLAWSGIFGILFFAAGLISGIAACIKEKFRCLNNPYLVCLLLCVMIQANLDIAVLGDMRNPATYFFWLIFGFMVHGVMAEE